MMAACCEPIPTYENGSLSNPTGDPLPNNIGKVELFTVEFRGEKHEYVLWSAGGGDCSRGSLSHWEDCKYCKEKEMKKKTYSIFDD